MNMDDSNRPIVMSMRTRGATSRKLRKQMAIEIYEVNIALSKLMITNNRAGWNNEWNG